MKEFTPRPNGYKVYTPTISKLKRSKLTLITEKNVWKVMGDINRFMKKPCMKLSSFDNTKGTGNVIYRQYNGGECYPHPLYTEKSPFGMKDLRLAIGSKYYLNCDPICIGDRYKIMGNRLVIMHKYNKYVAYTPWLRYVEFIHKNDVNVDDIKKDIAAGAIGRIFENDYEYIRNYPSEVHRRFQSIENQVQEIIKSVFSADSSVYADEIIKNINCDGLNIGFIFKPNLYIDKGDRGDYYSFYVVNGCGESKNTTSSIDAIEFLFGPLMQTDIALGDYDLDYDEEDHISDDPIDPDPEYEYPIY